MKEMMKILGHGNSSVAGTKWFLIGCDADVVLAVCDNDHPADGPDRWIMFPYRPGIDWNKTKGEVADPAIVDFCRRGDAAENLNWNDNRKASALYWDFKESTG